MAQSGHAPSKTPAAGSWCKISSHANVLRCAAVETGAVDFMLPLSQIPTAILSLVAIRGADELFRVSPDFAFGHVQKSRGVNLSSY